MRLEVERILEMLNLPAEGWGVEEVEGIGV